MSQVSRETETNDEDQVYEELVSTTRDAQFQEYYQQQAYVQSLESQRAAIQAFLDEIEQEYGRVNVECYGHLQQGKDKRAVAMARTRRRNTAAHTIDDLEAITKNHPNLRAELARQEEALFNDEEEEAESLGSRKLNQKFPTPHSPRRTASQQLRDAQLSSSPRGSKVWSSNSAREEKSEDEEEQKKNRWTEKE